MDGLEGVQKENEIESRMLLEFCNQKDLCVGNTWFKKEKTKVTYSSCGNEAEINFVLVEKECRKFLKDVKVTLWELQHKLVVVDVKKVNLFKHIKMKQDMQ